MQRVDSVNVCKLAPVGGAKRRSRAWTDEDERYLRRHRHDGRAAVAEALGRSPEAVRRHALRLGFTVPIRPRQGEVCPICGRWRMSPGTEAYAAGYCQVCWGKHKRAVFDQRIAERAEQRAYEALKKRRQRALERS